MKIIRSEIFASALLFTLLLIGLYFNSTAQPQNSGIYKTEQPALIFEKKPCFGFCPVYKASFFANGKVEVTYTKSGENPQQTSFNLSKAEIKTLSDRAEKLGVFKMKDTYETLMTDFPVRELTVNFKNKTKTISYTEGASPEFETYLQDLAALVERNLNVDFKPTGNK